MRFCIALLLLALIAGCASGPRDPRYSLEGKGDAGETGVVFGKICEGNGMQFRQEGSSEEILHIGGGGGEFALRLPPGKYVLADIGSSAGGDFTSPNPFSFEVRAHEVVYLGTLFPTWFNLASDAPKLCPKELGALILIWDGAGKKMYGQRSPNSPVFITNDMDEAQKAVKARYPNVDLSGAVVRLMQ